jgi:hypothetical protein
MTIWFIVIVVMHYMTDTVLDRALPDWTDLHKALFVILVAPAATEVALTIGRFVTRGIPERHEAASWVLNSCKGVRPRTHATRSKAHGCSPSKSPRARRHPHDKKRANPPDHDNNTESTYRCTGGHARAAKQSAQRGA